MAKRDESRDGQDAQGVLEMLREDHRKVRELFQRFEREQADREDGENARAVRDLAMEVMVHAVLEEELFYPAAMEALGEEALVDQALVEHQSARALVDQLAGEEPEEEMYTARVHVLGEYVAHHIDEEENVLFPRLQEAGFDDEQLAARMLERKRSLMGRARPMDLKELADLAGQGGARAGA